MTAHSLFRNKEPPGFRADPRRKAGPPARARKGWLNPVGPAVVGLALLISSGAKADCPPSCAPTVLDPNLEVRTVADGLDQPTSMVFLPNDNVDLDLLVLERRTGIVRHLVRDLAGPGNNPGAVRDLGAALDLNVNSAGVRGLLGSALHPEFSNTDRKKRKPWVYLFWTESNTGGDVSNGPGNPAKTLLLGNHVDRFIWNGSSLAFDRNLINLRALQTDGPENHAPASHNGGVLRFGPDGKLYIAVGDVGRRGWMQNLPCGPTEICPGSDDSLGGPQPDNNHLTGVILRLKDDGSTPKDNPFFEAYRAAADNGSEVAKNIQKIFAYGIRNPYGMDFDPASGNLWLEENGEDSFSELHRIEPGQNGGWVQIRGPVSRTAQYREIETSQGSPECPLDPSI